MRKVCDTNTCEPQMRIMRHVCEFLSREQLVLPTDHFLDFSAVSPSPSPSPFLQPSPCSPHPSFPA